MSYSSLDSHLFCSPTSLSPSYLLSSAGEEKQAGDATCSHSVPVDLAERYQQRNGAWDDEEGAQPILAECGCALIFLSSVYGAKSGIDSLVLTSLVIFCVVTF